MSDPIYGGCFIWLVGGCIVGALWAIESAVRALTRAQVQANQVARDRLSLERQRFERGDQ